MDRVEVGKTALTGWRVKVADGVAGPLARRTPWSDDAVRALLGTVFFAMSTYYVVSTLARMVRAARES